MVFSHGRVEPIIVYLIDRTDAIVMMMNTVVADLKSFAYVGKITCVMAWMGML